MTQKSNKKHLNNYMLGEKSFHSFKKKTTI